MPSLRVSSDHEKRFPGSERLSTEAVINLLRANSLVSAELNQLLRPFDLSISTFNVLMILEGSKDPLCPHQIGERLLVTRGTVTGLLDSLESKKLITRSPHPKDRRMLQIELTKKGRDLLQEVWRIHFPGEKQLMSCLTRKDKAELISILGKVQDALSSTPRSA